MIDNLRTRIAVVLADNVCTLAENGPCADCVDSQRPVADAVIRELGPLVRYWDKDFKELHYCRECGGWGPKDD